MERAIAYKILTDEYDKLLAHAVKLVGDPHTACDVVQELGVRVAEGFFDRREPENKRAYLHTCLRHLAYDIIKKSKRESAQDALEETIHDRASAENLKRIEIKEWINKYIASFPEDMREAFLMYILDGYQMAEIARQMGISEATLRQRFRRMKKTIPLSARFTLFILQIPNIFCHVFLS
ncbi:RNA polymerase sigma factor [Christensenellaceae bacterium OttesenSCG-928-M15]|nr:RNA polymerase sigma factor [Christensenellaceae bacterium OttesenSCG-928-M15]